MRRRSSNSRTSSSVREKVMVSGMVLNPKELLQQQDQILSAWQKCKNGLLASVRSLLTLPFLPNALVALIRPQDMSTVWVRQQHIFDCLTGSRKKNNRDLFDDPKANRHQNDSVQECPAAAASAQSVPVDTQLQHEVSYLLSISSGSDLEDIGAIRHQNQTLGKRSRSSGRTGQHGAGLFLDDANSSSDEDAEPACRMFRPSATQQRVSRTVLHARFQGKSCPYIFE
ncbi:unnamed protein product [Phytophthora fragariaefolia]|uniref:Unnamed protein product n=1 Tax=Phytophthora fragariaefolia TaxID=1490495 RepID=A0A9W6YDG1_9STRA|nr:unnamed protein product [Phytophthora fragariaefolia]